MHNAVMKIHVPKYGAEKCIKGNQYIMVIPVYYVCFGVMQRKHWKNISTFLKTIFENTKLSIWWREERNDWHWHIFLDAIYFFSIYATRESDVSLNSNWNFWIDVICEFRFFSPRSSQTKKDACSSLYFVNVWFCSIW